MQWPGQEMPEEGGEGRAEGVGKEPMLPMMPLEGLKPAAALLVWVAAVVVAPAVLPTDVLAVLLLLPGKGVEEFASLDVAGETRGTDGAGKREMLLPDGGGKGGLLLSAWGAIRGLLMPVALPVPETVLLLPDGGVVRVLEGDGEGVLATLAAVGLETLLVPDGDVCRVLSLSAELGEDELPDEGEAGKALRLDRGAAGALL